MTTLKAKAAEFAALDQVIPGGTTCIETDTGRRRLGDGRTRYTGLKVNDHNVYIDPDTGLASVDGVPLALPQRLPSTTVATIATAFPPATYAQCCVYVSDGTSNKRLAISDGAAWRWPDGAVVS